MNREATEETQDERGKVEVFLAHLDFSLVSFIRLSSVHRWVSEWVSKHFSHYRLNQTHDVDETWPQASCLKLSLNYFPLEIVAKSDQVRYSTYPAAALFTCIVIQNGDLKPNAILVHRDISLITDQHLNEPV